MVSELKHKYSIVWSALMVRGLVTPVYACLPRQTRQPVPRHCYCPLRMRVVGRSTN